MPIAGAVCDVAFGALNFTFARLEDVGLEQYGVQPSSPSMSDLTEQTLLTFAGLLPDTSETFDAAPSWLHKLYTIFGSLEGVLEWLRNNTNLGRRGSASSGGC